MAGLVLVIEAGVEVKVKVVCKIAAVPGQAAVLSAVYWVMEAGEA